MEYYARLYHENAALAAAAIEHVPPIAVLFKAENVPPTGMPFLDNAGAGTRQGAMDKIKRASFLFSWILLHWNIFHIYLKIVNVFNIKITG